MTKSVIVGLDGQPMRASHYDGASTGRRAVGWSASSAGPNRVMASTGEVLRNRTRAGYRNSLLMRSAINKNTTSEVGKGFTLMSTTKDEKFAKEVNRLWRILSTQIDPWGDFNLGALVHLAVKSRRMAGEVFIRRLRRRLASGLVVPLQVELLEADMCPLQLNKRFSATHRIVQGVEFFGKRKVAYWFYKAHPQDGLESASLNNLLRVPARDVIHHYMPSRPGQVRAEPDTAAALLKDHTFHRYDDQELVRKETRSGFTGFLYREGVGEADWEFDPNTGKPMYPDEVDAAPTEAVVQAGTILRGVPGEKLELFNGDDTGAGYKDYIRWQTLMLAAGQEIPHALLTGDWSGLNDRLVRAFMIEYRRGMSFDQTNLSGFQVMFGIWRWALEAMITTGLVTAPGFAENPWPWLEVDIRPDAWKHLHPEQEINARIKAINSQTSNVEREAAEHGGDVEDNMRRNARALKRWHEICEEEGVENPGSMAGVFSTPESQKDTGASDE
ncbi:MAG: phage portal protein [Shewanella sp.]|nr:phage portal protein [Shewanella sp.]